MISITSLEGPEVHGPSRYRVAPPTYLHNEKTYTYGLSYQTVLLDGKEVFIDHVSHTRVPNYPKELIIVVRPKPQKRLQCKDIPDTPVLEFLRKQIKTNSPYKNDPTLRAHWSTWGEGYGMPTVNDAMPMVNESNGKLALAKMRQLMKRKLVSGCSCGCRGDFVITDKGLDYLLDHKNEASCEARPTGII